MKKIRLLALIMTVGTGVMSAANLPSMGRNTKSAIDTVSYIIGASYGQGLREQVKQFPGPPISMDDLINGFVNAAKGDSVHLGMNMEEVQLFLTDFFQEFQNRIEEKETIEAEKFLAENKEKSGVITTESGLQYKVITEGAGPKPKEDDVVKVIYRGSFIDGEVFDSTEQHGGEASELPLNNLIPGFSEGLLLMPVGSKYMLWLPLELGYYNVPNHRLSNKLLIFEIELLEIVSK